ncbi:class I SAM-dependent methyltransferase [Puniceicoccales bacterium CK1056]|uniref:Class I SAM-dependent methyltransferase n=1 Tax=Oceanipulchritudo coccoides TaxID=2706888 RepID=A0A6B2M1Y8_9BACT|nr:class I SAM-dependent methyltransferase [Oceanipulchritudo coccoides]NDV62948.1 class I SAM-dependent methyltransferase [Oceanipulchritudo coccoides]
MSEVDEQRQYYKDTAGSYDDACVADPNDEHFIASALLSGIFRHYNIKSVLDVGCGTGRSINYLEQRHPEMTFMGVEPVKELRDVAIGKGLKESQLAEGDACNLDYEDGAFDCVMMFGVLHHIPDPEPAIREALRVSRKLVFISDHNVYGMGSPLTKRVKQCFRDLHLRWLLKLLLTGGKGYHSTNWDGIFYPFSLVDYFPLIRAKVAATYTFSTKTAAVNLYRDASHLAILGVKEDE